MALRRTLMAIILLISAQPAAAQLAEPIERVEADVSTRTLSITSGYAGAQILVFGAVENSRQPSAEAGTYDIVVVVEGTSVPTVVRRKSRVAGVWINTSAQRFASLPGYYAIVATRPLDEIASAETLDRLKIGFEYVRMIPAASSRTEKFDTAELDNFRKAVVRLRRSDGLYKLSEYGVAFSGRSVFRSTINLPPNAPIGPLQARVYLFRDGMFLSQYTSKVVMERAGVERFIHHVALRRPILYGATAVLLAAAAGFAASVLFNRKAA